MVSQSVFRERLIAMESWLWGEGSSRVGLAGAAAAIDAVADQVKALSDLYTIDRTNLRLAARATDYLAAKTLYFICSDAPKVWCVLDELTRRSPTAGYHWSRVLDLGAGVGATSAGFLLSLDAEALRDQQRDFLIDLHGVDTDSSALTAWRAIVAKAAEIAGVRVRARSSIADAHEPPLDAPAPGNAPGPGSGGASRGASGGADSRDRAADVVLAQAVMNELFHGATGDAAATGRAAWLAKLAARSTAIIIEPALRETTRPLMAARDILAKREDVALLAPCPHRFACPMLPMERDWCHEVRVIPPTPRVARVQALTRRRDERTKFSFLALAPAANVLTEEASLPGAIRGRLVSDTLNSKGKAERLICSSQGKLVRLRLLDRDRNEGNTELADAERGSRVEVAGAGDRGRVGAEAKVRPLD